VVNSASQSAESCAFTSALIFSIVARISSGVRGTSSRFAVRSGKPGSVTYLRQSPQRVRRIQGVRIPPLDFSVEEAKEHDSANHGAGVYLAFGSWDLGVGSLLLPPMRHLLTGFALVGALLAPWSAARAWAQHETAQDLLDGQRAYGERCATCHGPNGDLVPNINFAAGVFRRPMTDADLARIIRQGIPNTPMPASNVSEAQAGQIVAYLRS